MIAMTFKYALLFVAILMILIADSLKNKRKAAILSIIGLALFLVTLHLSLAH